LTTIKRQYIAALVPVTKIALQSLWPQSF